MLTQYTVMAVFCRADQRRRHIDQMWAPDGRLAVLSLRLTTEGVDDINAHISQVHDDPDRDKGLAFTYDQAVFGEIVRLDVARPRDLLYCACGRFLSPDDQEVEVLGAQALAVEPARPVGQLEVRQPTRLL